MSMNHHQYIFMYTTKIDLLSDNVKIEINYIFLFLLPRTHLFAQQHYTLVCEKERNLVNEECHDRKKFTTLVGRLNVL